MICASCGERTAVLEGLCGECFSQKHPFFLKDDTMKVCRECGASYVREWKRDDVTEKYMQSALRGFSIVESFSSEKRDEARYSVREGGDCYLFCVETRRNPSFECELFEKTSFSLKKKFTLCPTCQKKKSGYFEAILQVRREGGILTEKEKEDMEGEVALLVGKEGDPLAFLSGVRDVHEGLNFEIGGKKIARRIVLFLKRKYGGTISESNKVMGRHKRTGKDILRLTVTLKLPSLKEGDCVIFEGEGFRVEGVSQTLRLLNASGQKSIPSDKITEMEKKGKLTRLGTKPEKILITSLAPDHVEILRSDYSTSMFPRPQNLRVRVGEEYEVIILEDKIFWV